jgi:A/G-specific adenine glycosylase
MAKLKIIEPLFPPTAIIDINRVPTNNSSSPQKKVERIVTALLGWFTRNARDLPWRRTHDPYAIWVSEIMLQQTQVKTVIPFWERWLRELPTIAATASARPEKIHKLWEGLGYYTRVRNLQKAAQTIVEKHDGKFPTQFDQVLALPGIGNYTAGAICSIAFNQPTPILDGNVMRVLCRVFGIAENPKEKATNQKLWQLAEQLVVTAVNSRPEKPVASQTAAVARASHLNQALMELGALICTPRNAQCLICPLRQLCAASREQRVEELPNLGKRVAATQRRFLAFILENNQRLLVRQRPAGVVNAHLWEFPNIEVSAQAIPAESAQTIFGVIPQNLLAVSTIKHSITRYRITLEAFRVRFAVSPPNTPGTWKTPAQIQKLAFSAAHKKLATAAIKSIMSDR